MDSTRDTSNALEPLQIYSAMRGQIEHEDNLINARIIWMVIAQSFLFSSFATALNSPAPPSDQFFPALHNWLLWLIPGIGVSLSLLVGISIAASLRRLEELRLMFTRYRGPQEQAQFPPIESTTMADSLGPLPPILIPCLFIASWTALLLRHAFE
jgi:hypothetical protein